MPISVSCQCGQSFVAKDSLAGRTVKCPKCGNPLAIPSPNQPAPSAELSLELPSEPTPQPDPIADPLSDPLAGGMDLGALESGSDPLSNPLGTSEGQVAGFGDQPATMAQPGQPFGQPAQAAPAKPTSSKRGLIIGLSVGGGVLVLLVLVVVYVFMGGSGNDPSTQNNLANSSSGGSNTNNSNSGDSNSNSTDSNETANDAANSNSTNSNAVNSNGTANSNSNDNNTNQNSPGLPAPTNDPDRVVKWQPFVDEQNHFVIDYPGYWDKRESQSDGGYKQVMTVDSTTYSFTIKNLPPNRSYAGPSAFEAGRDAMVSAAKGTLISSELVWVCANPGIRFTYDDMSNGVASVHHVLSSKIEDRAFLLTYDEPKAATDPDRAQKYFDSIKLCNSTISVSEALNPLKMEGTEFLEITGFKGGGIEALKKHHAKTRYVLGRRLELTGVLIDFGESSLNPGSGTPPFGFTFKGSKDSNRRMFCATQSTTPWSKLNAGQKVTIRGWAMNSGLGTQPTITDVEIVQTEGKPTPTVTNSADVTSDLIGTYVIVRGIVQEAKEASDFSRSAELTLAFGSGQAASIKTAPITDGPEEWLALQANDQIEALGKIVSADGQIKIENAFFVRKIPQNAVVNTTPDPAPAPESTSPTEPVIRIWASADGKFSITAEFVSQSATEVVLKREDGKEITVPVSSLSQADQQFLSDLKNDEP